MFTHVMITRAFSVFFILFFTLYFCKTGGLKLRLVGRPVPCNNYYGYTVEVVTHVYSWPSQLLFLKYFLMCSFLSRKTSHIACFKEMVKLFLGLCLSIYRFVLVRSCILSLKVLMESSCFSSVKHSKSYFNDSSSVCLLHRALSGDKPSTL